MKKDLTKIVNDLLWAADDVCLDNSKDPVDCSSANADIVRCPLGQNDWDNVPDKGVRAILQQHGLKLSDINALVDAGVMVLNDTDDHPGCVIDDRCLHVSMHMDKVLQHMSLSNHNLIQVTPDQMMAMS
jgi:hypothetical protein|tara:strand:+ start:90 stop:476 length:387 start_codon:yes stop_codon:yes gene_type:complete